MAGSRGESADIKSDLTEAHRHEDGGSKKRHPTRKSVCRSGQVNQRESKKHDQNRSHCLQPGSPKYARVVLVAERDQFGTRRTRRRPTIDSK